VDDDALRLAAELADPASADRDLLDTIAALAALAGEEALAPLVAFLGRGDRSMDVRIVAAEEIRRIGPGPVVDRLRELARTHRELADRALGIWEPPEPAPLEEALRNPASTDGELLEWMRLPYAVTRDSSLPPLLALLEDEKRPEEVRVLAARLAHGLATENVSGALALRQMQAQTASAKVKQIIGRVAE
jgi:hypothetical protein